MPGDTRLLEIALAAAGEGDLAACHHRPLDSLRADQRRWVHRHPPHSHLVASRGGPLHRSRPRVPLLPLILGGDLGLDSAGILREKRIHGGEIRTRRGELAFSRWNAHRAVEGSQPPVPVIEFTFPRLVAGRHYDPLLFALKGFQRALNPLPLVGPNGPLDRRYYRQMEQALLQWAAAPTPVDEGIITEFIHLVARGLRMEREAGHGHSPGECADGLSAWRPRRGNGKFVSSLAGRLPPLRGVVAVHEATPR